MHKNVLCSAIVTASVGVRQGAPSSCLLFLIYIDQMVKMLNDEIGTDGFLGTLHALLLMDDTVLVATSREKCLKKMDVVMRYCEEYGMVINEKKTKFFVVGGDEADALPLLVRGANISYSNKYLYLGAWFTDDGKINTVMKLHESSNEATVNKFAIFCASNTEMPFTYKRQVFDAAMSGSLLYSRETWFTGNPKKLKAQYDRSVRSLLGVRHNTSIALCQVEAGIHPVQDKLIQRRFEFLRTKLQTRNSDEPLYIIYELCRQANTPGFKFLSHALQHYQQTDPLNKMTSYVRERQDATKFTVYRSLLNPSLSVHNIYSSREFIPDYKRQSFTRIRVMSHSLRVETGRWGRIPPDLRLCSFNQNVVQSEEHILLACPISQTLTQRYKSLDFTNMETLMESKDNEKELCNFIHDVLGIYA